MLWLVWSLSLVLGAISLLVMAALILRRVVVNRRGETDAAMRRSLVHTLIAFSAGRDAEALKAALRETPPRVALESGFEFLDLLRGEEHDRIVEVFADAGLVDHVRMQLAKGNEAERLHAAEMIEAFPSEQAAAALLDALERDRSREVRIAAAISLTGLGRLPPLAEVLTRIGVRGQRSRRLIELFARFPEERFGDLVDYAKDGGSAFVRASAIEALAQSGDYRFAPLFQTLAKDSASEVAAAAIRALGRLGHPDAEFILLDAMGSRSWEVRADAAEAAGRIGTPALIEPLIRLLEDDTWTVRYAAAKAVRLILPGGEAALRHVASSQTSRSQRTASLVLAEGIAR